MKTRKYVGLMLAFVLAVSSLGTPAVATETEFQRSTGSFSMTISAGKYKKANTSFTLEAGETVTINATYTPRNASVDFGLVDANNTFTYINVTSGSIDDGVITVSTRGTYTLAIRNNSSNQVDVSGFVEC